MDRTVAVMDQYELLLRNVLAPIAVKGDFRTWVAVNDAQGPPLTQAMTEDIQTLRDMEAAEAAAANAAIGSSYEAQRTMSIAIIVVGIVLAAALGLVVALGVARAARRVQDVTTALAAFTVRISSRA